MTNVKCNILTKGKDIETVFVNSHNREFEVNENLYIIPNSLCLIVIDNGKIQRNPELFYVEGNPYPLSSLKEKQNSLSTLNDKIFENAIRQSSGSFTFDIFGLMRKIGWRNFFIGLGAVGVIYWIVTGVI